MAGRQALQVDAATIERLSDTILERVVGATTADGRIPEARATDCLDAKKVADTLRLERHWIYQHPDELDAPYARSAYVMLSRHNDSSLPVGPGQLAVQRDEHGRANVHEPAAARPARQGRRSRFIRTHASTAVPSATAWRDFDNA
jgi:hypothetical protein